MQDSKYQSGLNMLAKCPAMTVRGEGWSVMSALEDAARPARAALKEPK